MMKNSDSATFVFMLIAAAILIPLSIWLTKAIVYSDLPMWLKVMLLR